MTIAVRDIFEMFTGRRLPIIRASADRVAVNYPFLTETGIVDPRTGQKVPGRPIGTCGLNGYGGTMYYDQVELYKAQIVEDTNDKVFGEVGQHKSGDNKGEVYFDSLVGKTNIVTDIKGEYTPLAGIIPGSKILRFGSDQSLRLNLIDSQLSIAVQDELQKNVCLSVMAGTRQDLTQAEKDALWYGSQDARRDRTQPVLSHLLDAVSNPSSFLLEKVTGLDPKEGAALDTYRHDVKDLRSVLQRLDTGSLAGPFSGTTTEGLFDVVPLLVMNLEDVPEENLPLMLTMLNFFVYGKAQATSGAKKKFDFIRHDEAWKLVTDPAFLKSIVALFKMGNSRGISNRIIAHHPSDLYGAGMPKLAEALMRDSSTTILYSQNREELETYAGLLKLHENEVDIVATQLKPGEALYKVGDMPGIRVQHTITNHPKLRKVVETRGEWEKNDM